VAAKYQKKPKGSYHHPDLETALVDAALRTIAEKGVEALTLRGVGARLGVSRTALYRHFQDRTALVARVALEGFRKFGAALREAVDRARAAGLDPMEEMGIAYIRFAIANQSHYKTMFGAVAGDWRRFKDLVTEADAAFAVLENTIIEQQRAGVLVEADPESLAAVVWAHVHGIASLVIAGHLPAAHVEDLERMSWRTFVEGASRRRRTRANASAGRRG